jgi:O-succinylbenzoate synthase
MTDGDAEILRVPLAVRPEARAIVGADAREVAFLRVVDEATGRVGFGECAPLAGLHAESLDEACEALEAWCDGACALDELPPSAAFAASTAVEMLDGFGAKPCAPAQVAGFLAGGAAELDGRAVARLDGVRSVKLKIGRASPAEDRARLERALEVLPHARLRLDGNRGMSLASCIELLRGIDPRRIEYLEEPIADPRQLEELSFATGMAVALDELVVDRTDEARALRAELAHGRKVVLAWVLRMSALGSLDAIRARAAEAAALGVPQVVLSTAYESSFALRVAAHLAASLPNARGAHGIGTAALLAEDSCAPAIPVRGELAGDPLPVPFAEAWS